jgi:DNA-binding transcriptional regulator LsrR (DeoR family)
LCAAAELAAAGEELGRLQTVRSLERQTISKHPSSPEGPSKGAAVRPLQAVQATRAARRFFLDGWTIKEIAADLGVSRFKVARLIKWARTEGLVRIEIVDATRNDAELSAQLLTAYGLADALVVADLDGPAHSVAPELAAVAALAVAELVAPPDVVGISWGRTLDQIVERLPEFRARRVVQLIGGVATLESAAGGIELVRSFAARAHAEAYPLLAPLLVRDPAAAESLRRDPIVAETLALIGDVTVVVAGIGSWGEPHGSRMIECFTAEERAELSAHGVVADLCGLLFTAAGEVPDHPIGSRIGISLEQLRGAQTVVAVAGGTEKQEAIAAVLRAGIVDVLITDAGSARALVRAPSAALAGTTVAASPAADLT